MSNYNTNLDKLIFSSNLTKFEDIWYRIIHKDDRNSDDTIEIGLKEAKQEVKKLTGREYCDRTFTRAIAKYEETGLIKIVRKYSGQWYKITLPRGFNKNVKPETKPAKKTDSTSDKPFEVCLQQHLYLKNEQAKQKLKEEFTNKWNTFRNLLIEVGISYKRPAFERLVKNYSIEELEKSLKLFEVRGGMRATSNPSGWIVRCLKERWWEDWEHYLGLSQITNGFRYPISVARRYVQKFFDDHVPKEIPYEYLQRLIVEA